MALGQNIEKLPSLSQLHGFNGDELGQSSRVYCRAIGRVPFEWEAEPGKPKSPARHDAVPPLSPSPAMQAERLARDGRRSGRGGFVPSSEPAGLEGCLPFKFHFVRAIKKWDFICFLER